MQPPRIPAPRHPATAAQADAPAWRRRAARPAGPAGPSGVSAHRPVPCRMPPPLGNTTKPIGRHAAPASGTARADERSATPARDGSAVPARFRTGPTSGIPALPACVTDRAARIPDPAPVPPRHARRSAGPASLPQIEGRTPRKTSGAAPDFTIPARSRADRGAAARPRIIDRTMAQAAGTAASRLSTALAGPSPARAGRAGA